MRRDWRTPNENLVRECELYGGSRLVCLDRRSRLQSDPLVLYPELIYRRYGPSGEFEEEAILKIAMRC